MESREIHRMGTIIQLSIQHNHANVILDEIIDRLKRYEKRFSAHDSASELMEVNNNAGLKQVKVNPSLYELIKIGKIHSSAPNSSLNIAIGPLVNAWRIGFEDAKVPSQRMIQTLLSKTQVRNIILDDQNQTVFLKQKGMFIDLGALAKGYIADLLIHDLESLNVSSALINLGGNVMTYGISPNRKDGYWRIGIQHPFLPRGNYIAILKALNQSVVTSGIYERTFTMNNQTYHHILDPNTGYPIKTEVAGLTIVSEKSVDGEIWTGRLFGQTPHQIIDTLNQLKDIEGIIITKNSELLYTESLKSYLTEAVS